MSTRTLTWLFGRGASCACGLCWDEPEELKALDREPRIVTIQAALTAEMNGPRVNLSPYRTLFDQLRRDTVRSGWNHLFSTTNWDALLERALAQVCSADRTVPDWLESTFVYHLNGRVERLGIPEYGSSFLLPTDPAGVRERRLESDRILSILKWEQTVVVVGMRFECVVDKSLLTALGLTGYPIEASTWIVVNQSQADLAHPAP